MNTSFFIAKKIANNSQNAFSAFIIRLATIATVLSVAVMIIAVAVVNGFKGTIKEKTFEFWGHLQVTSNENTGLLVAQEPFTNDKYLVNNILSVPGVQSIQGYALGSAIIATNEVSEGLKLKGLDTGFNFQSNLAIKFEGKSLQIGKEAGMNEIMLSSRILDKLNMKIGDAVLVYFIDPEQSTPKIRKLTIVGTYHSGVEEIDNAFGLCDIQLLRKIYEWSNNAINGYQIKVKHYEKANEIAYTIFDQFLTHPLGTIGIDEIYPNIYQWLDFLDVNTVIILSIMACVAVINMITALLIFILERSNMIGILKTLGMKNKDIQNIFVFHIGRTVLKGILLGVAIGVILCLFQQYTHFFKIDEMSYYIDYVPIQLQLLDIVFIIIGTFVFCVLVLMIPPIIIRMLPIIKAIQFK